MMGLDLDGLHERFDGVSEDLLQLMEGDAGRGAEPDARARVPGRARRLPATPAQIV